MTDPEPDDQDDWIGPYYDTSGLRGWLGVSSGALADRTAAGELLTCVTSDGVRLYPVWQFTDDGSLLPGLPEVLAALRHGTGVGWIIAAWLRTPVEELDGTAVDWLAGGGDPALVIELARRDAAAWAA